MSNPDPEYNKVIRIYAALSASLVLSFVPHMLVAGLASLLFIGTLIAAYRIRSKAEQAGLAENHMTFVIRTLWISSLFACFTVAAGAFYILGTYDPAPIMRCLDAVMQNPALDPNALSAMTRPCMDDFMAANREPILIGSLITIGPVALYFVYRLAHGLSRAHKGYRIANVKSWF